MPNRFDDALEQLRGIEGLTPSQRLEMMAGLVTKLAGELKSVADEIREEEHGD